MTPVINIVYQPGAFGSYLSWVIDRFNKFRVQYEPKVTDDPFLKDGSSHGYASHCKIETKESFIDGYLATAKIPSPWGYNIYAGWPKGDISTNVNQLLEIMSPHDRVVLIECRPVTNHLLRWVRNELTMDQHRWWGMYGITSEDDYVEAFKKDWRSTSRYCAVDIRAGNDPRLFVIDMNDILEPKNSWRQLLIQDFLRWPSVDKELYIESSRKFINNQDKYLSIVSDIVDLDARTKQYRDKVEATLTPLQRALLTVRRKESLWI